jgi:hypothetical protein
MYNSVHVSVVNHHEKTKKPFVKRFKSLAPGRVAEGLFLSSLFFLFFFSFFSVVNTQHMGATDPGGRGSRR